MRAAICFAVAILHLILDEGEATHQNLMRRRSQQPWLGILALARKSCAISTPPKIARALVIQHTTVI